MRIAVLVEKLEFLVQHVGEILLLIRRADKILDTQPNPAFKEVRETNATRQCQPHQAPEAPFFIEVITLQEEDAEDFREEPRLDWRSRRDGH